MPMSQIDMVVIIDEGMLKVCGDFQLDAGRPERPPEVRVVIRQGDIVAKGQRAVDEDLGSWTVVVAADHEQKFTTGDAIACGVIIIEKEQGLEALSWVQKVDINPYVDSENNAFDFPPEESVPSPDGGQLENGRAVSSSLTILKQPNPQDGDTLSWRREVSIRRVAHHRTESPSRLAGLSPSE